MLSLQQAVGEGITVIVCALRSATNWSDLEAWTHTHTHIRTHKIIRTNAHTHKITHTYARMCTCVHKPAFTHVHIPAHSGAHRHKRTHIYTHTNSHTHTCTAESTAPKRALDAWIGVAQALRDASWRRCWDALSGKLLIMHWTWLYPGLITLPWLCTGTYTWYATDYALD
jgi:hypothetical protein